MDPGTALALAALLGGTLFFVPVVRHFNQQRAATIQAWRVAAQAAGFTEVAETGHSRPGDFVTSPRLVATGGRFTVSFEQVKLLQDRYATRVRIGGLPPALTLRLETGATRSARRSGHRDLEVGDADFDDEVYIQGPAVLVQAVMDHALRLRVRSMLGNDVEVRGGALYALVPNAYGDGSEYGRGPGEPLKAVLPLLVEFATRLMRPEDLVNRLAASAQQDPVAGVRVANLLALAREYPGHAATRPALLAALADRDDEVRLRAATLLTPEGTPVLLAIAAGENTDDSCAGRAVTALGSHLPPERTLEILIHALRARRMATASACLAALGHSRPPGAIGTLAKVLARESGPLAEAAARALGAYGRPEAEAALIAALERQAAPPRVAAAEALGASGSVAAVEPLRRAEANHSRDGGFRRAARQAIAAIQSRAGSASPGRLTLAEGESGRLSLEDDSAGHVSLAPANNEFPGRG